MDDDDPMIPFNHPKAAAQSFEPDQIKIK